MTTDQSADLADLANDLGLAGEMGGTALAPQPESAKGVGLRQARRCLRSAVHGGWGQGH